MLDVSRRTQATAKRRKSNPLGNHGLHSVSPARFLGRLRYQLFLGVLVAVILPAAFYHWPDVDQAWKDPVTIKTTLGSLLAVLIAIYLFRRVVSFPGVGIAGYVLPTATAGYSLALVGILGIRIEYSRLIFAISFVTASLFLFAISAYVRNRKHQRFYVVPSTATCKVPVIPHVAWTILPEPRLPADNNLVLIADLRAELDPDWERLIAEAAVAGFPVYHIKQVMESLTGRVEIEHLSENSFGSLVPNLAYRKIKRAIDLLAASVLLPLLIIPGLIVALIIKLESPGPVFFVQTRMGYRAKCFEMVKFRTMRHGEAEQNEGNTAITLPGDGRITGFGRFLRRTRIDELPQIWNIILGQMSWIGPRPEALSLSAWYTAELPFYSYRHIVRPGITGWAQVQQGHVANLPEVQEKLHYDFFYIKNFSAWLDLLILGRTMSIVFSGFGAK